MVNMPVHPPPSSIPPTPSPEGPSDPGGGLHRVGRTLRPHDSGAQQDKGEVISKLGFLPEVLCPQDTLLRLTSR